MEEEQINTRIYKTPIYVRRCIERYRQSHIEEIRERARVLKKEQYANNEEFREKKKEYNKTYNQKMRAQKKQMKETELQTQINNIVELLHKKLD